MGKLNGVIKVHRMIKAKDITGLNNALNNPDNTVRQEALSGLIYLDRKSIRDKSSIEPLQNALKDPNTNVRRLAARALRNIGTDFQEERERNELEKKAKGYEQALNLSKAAEAYEELEMWEEARRCREGTKGIQDRSSHIVPPPPQPDILRPKNYQISKEEAKNIITNGMSIIMPNHIEANLTDEIIVQLQNNTNQVLEDVGFDFSGMKNFFEIIGEIELKSLPPGINMTKRVRIKPLHEEGVFPIKIKITGSGATIEKEYTIKVGGTEIY